MTSPLEFTSDGCTGFFDTWRGVDLQPCCTAHDLAWWQSPGDWSLWFGSNVDLGVCFYQAGVWELAIPACLAVTTIGAVLFALKRKERG